MSAKKDKVFKREVNITLTKQARDVLNYVGLDPEEIIDHYSKKGFTIGGNNVTVYLELLERSKE